MFSISLVAGHCILLFLIYKYLIYPSCLSPLSKIPNAHPTSPFSPLWILWKRYSEQENRSIHAAHQKHGDIVRLGPNEVSVACVDEGVRTIYSGGFEKWPWYENQFQNYGYVTFHSHCPACLSKSRLLTLVQCSKFVFHDIQQTPLHPKTNDIKRLLKILPAIIARTPQNIADDNPRPASPPPRQSFR